VEQPGREGARARAASSATASWIPWQSKIKERVKTSEKQKIQSLTESLEERHAFSLCKQL